MAARIIKQPNGLLARFSFIVDNITHYDMTVKQAVRVCEESGCNLADATSMVRLGIEPIPPGISRFCWAKAVGTIRQRYGDEKAAEIDALGQTPADPEDLDLTLPEFSPRDEALLLTLCKMMDEKGITIDQSYIPEVIRRFNATCEKWI